MEEPTFTEPTFSEPITFQKVSEISELIIENLPEIGNEVPYPLEEVKEELPVEVHEEPKVPCLDTYGLLDGKYLIKY